MAQTYDSDNYNMSHTSINHYLITECNGQICIENNFVAFNDPGKYWKQNSIKEYFMGFKLS